MVWGGGGNRSTEKKPRPSGSELTYFLTVGFIVSGIRTKPVRGTVIYKQALRVTQLPISLFST